MMLCGENSSSFLEGERLLLNPISKKHITQRYVSWLNDPVVCAGNSHGKEVYSIEKAEEYFSQVSTDTSKHVFAIETKEGVHIGNIALQKIDKESMCAEYAILIGERDYWSGGYGLEASRLLLNYAFTNLELNRVYAGTYSNNQGMIKLASKMGMKQEGLRRKAVCKEGKFLDVLEFGILKDEFFKERSGD